MPPYFHLRSGESTRAHGAGFNSFIETNPKRFRELEFAQTSVVADFPVKSWVSRGCRHRNCAVNVMQRDFRHRMFHSIN